METKRAILVVGPESSGTRLWTRILMAAGCAGDDTHEQRWDAGLPEDEDLIVWRRSIPHLGSWYRIGLDVQKLREAGFRVLGIVTMRDWRSLIRSQVAANHVAEFDEAMENVRLAYQIIFRHLNDLNIPCFIMSYESLVQRPLEVQQDLAARLGLPCAADGAWAVNVYDGNGKYYDEVVADCDPPGARAAERLLLGCGEERRAGWVHLDFSPRAAADVVHDLNVYPWPFEDGAFSEIEALDVLEHLDGVVPFMDECWRILRPGGRLTVRVPHYMDQNAWRDPTHKRAFHPDVFAYFDMRTQWGQRYGRLYTSRWWKMLEQRTVGGNITAVMEPVKSG
jgi:SAM-dependent methyltransferase